MVVKNETNFFLVFWFKTCLMEIALAPLFLNIYENCWKNIILVYLHNLSHTKPYLRCRIQKPSVDLHALSREATLPASQISSVNSFQNP